MHVPARKQISQVPNMHELAQLAAMVLQERCSQQRHLERVCDTHFHSSRIPQISVIDYVRRIAKYSCCSPECFVLSLIYMDRYLYTTRFPLTFRNVHRLMITAVLVSAKLRDDTYYTNTYYASLGGISTAELNGLELEFLKIIDWTTWVEPSQFEEYRLGLQARYSTSQLSPVAAGTSEYGTSSAGGKRGTPQR
ncbi:CYC2-like cyclin 6 [Trypanosoma conorhini]|uniref:Cyclin n=1 Tax=Trypanosoma conorhini TaxID=83891 RepID=A0A3R7LMS6_9TRYP|nr:CYC2-like cyclin 6 [Trypanosoma conorhini]RNF17490.1 CYC2-like cyclin 6 [Trypanosoma conorhini]